MATFRVGVVVVTVLVVLVCVPDIRKMRQRVSHQARRHWFLTTGFHLSHVNTSIQTIACNSILTGESKMQDQLC